MASAAPANLPLLYNDLVPLNTEQHGTWNYREVQGAPEFSKVHAVPITADEFVQAQHSLPIVFAAGGDPIPLALMGLNEGVNVLIDGEGKLRGQSYVPAYIRRYPWMLARLRPDTEELSLCFDPTFGAVGDFKEGDPIFVDGQPSEIIKSVLTFCEQFEQAAARSGQFIEDIKASGLLMDGEMSVQPDGAPQPFIYRGFLMVNEEKLREVRGDTLRKWNQNGFLALIYAHLFSLNNMREIFQKQMQLGLMPEPTLG